MQRTSELIGALAAALAKAQIELANPEKSMLATIEADGRRAANQIFRYAPLSSGLDIVRKTLGRHEIATVQTTAVDQTGEFVNLTTLSGAFVGGMDFFGLASLPCLMKWRARSVWARRLLMRGDMRFLRWSELRPRTISMRPT